LWFDDFRITDDAQKEKKNQQHDANFVSAAPVLGGVLSGACRRFA
jgi:hypothetical protein